MGHMAGNAAESARTGPQVAGAVCDQMVGSGKGGVGKTTVAVNFSGFAGAAGVQGRVDRCGESWAECADDVGGDVRQPNVVGRTGLS